MKPLRSTLSCGLVSLALPATAFAQGCAFFGSASCAAKNLLVALGIAAPLTLISAGALLTMVAQGFVRKRTPWMPAVGLTLPVSLLVVVAVGQGLEQSGMFRAQSHAWALIAWVSSASLIQLGYVVLCAWLLDARPPKVGE